MDIFLIERFIGEIKRQCSFALMAFNDLDGALRLHDINRIWFSIQSCLAAVANISKLLWGVDKKTADRRASLRKLLCVEDNSPLFDRDMRNNFEHFDERLDKWWKQSENKIYIDSCIGDVMNGISMQGDKTTAMLRNYNPETGILIYQGKEYQLSQVITSIKSLERTLIKAEVTLSQQR